MGVGRVRADVALGGRHPSLAVLVMVGGSVDSQALGMQTVAQCRRVHHWRLGCTEA